MKNKPKNVIMLLADDLGYWGLGSYGNNEIITPNIDKLAKEGAKFDNFYSASPVCSPARASLLTGEIPSQHGVHDWLNDSSEDEEIEYLEGRSSYVEEMSKNGMKCGLSGKWHLGASGKKQMYFDHWYAHKSGAGPYYSAPMYRDNELVIESEYITDLITDDAIDFIHQNKDDNFYLHVGYTAPHSPWLDNHPEKFEKLYDDCEFKSAPQEPNHPDSIFLTEEVQEDLRGNLTGYFAAVTAMDYNIGRLIKTLKDNDLYDDTLIIFTSDNGFSVGQHGFWGKGNGTFPINLYDTSVKVPFIMSYPKGIKKEQTINEMISAVDLRPTLLEILKYKDSTDKGVLPGNSFAELLKENTDNYNKNEYIYVFDEYGPNRMIRDEEFKFIQRYPHGPNEFYDMKNDSKETKNLIDNESYSEIISSLKLRLNQYYIKHANPEIDGSRENVVGSGQINKAGTWSKGKESYSVDDYIKESKNYNYD